MKHTFFKSLLLLTAGVYMLAGSSCKKLEDFDDTNDNPSGSSTPITSALLTNAEVGLGGIVSGVTTGGNKAGLYAQFFSETQYTDASLYAEPKLDMGGTYSGPLIDLQVIVNKNTDPATAGTTLIQGAGSNANQIAVATILKAYIFWTLTDRWGDVPYSEALKGAANLHPAFDKQEDIYLGIMQDLKDAVAGFDNGLWMQGDLFYNGDPAQWKKVANTLRMQIALRTTKVYPAAGQWAETEFSAAFNDPAGYMTTNADNMVIHYPGGSFKNPYFTIYDGRTDYAFSKTIGDIMSNMNDDRKDAGYKSAGPDFPYGLTRDNAIAFGSYGKYLAPAYRAEGSDVVVISASTSLLAAAEGVERWGLASPISAEQLYNDGVTESFDQWGVGGAAAAYLAGDANYNGGSGGGSDIGANAFGSIVGANATTNTKLERIALQRYLASYPNGIEAWSEWRRTGIPHLTPTTAATNTSDGSQIPRRYVYATAEYSLNPDQVAAAVARLTGGDKMSSRMWWDQ